MPEINKNNAVTCFKISKLSKQIKMPEINKNNAGILVSKFRNQSEQIKYLSK